VQIVYSDTRMLRRTAWDPTAKAPGSKQNEAPERFGASFCFKTL